MEFRHDSSWPIAIADESEGQFRPSLSRQSRAGWNGRLALPRVLAARSGDFGSTLIVIVRIQLRHNSLSLQIHEIFSTGDCRQAPHAALCLDQPIHGRDPKRVSV